MAVTWLLHLHGWVEASVTCHDAEEPGVALEQLRQTVSRGADLSPHTHNRHNDRGPGGSAQPVHGLPRPPAPHQHRARLPLLSLPLCPASPRLQGGLPLSARLHLQLVLQQSGQLGPRVRGAAQEEEAAGALRQQIRSVLKVQNLSIVISLS